MFSSRHTHDVDATLTSTVHEHRAPTDESVRLLREMEASARKAVEKAVRVTNSPIDCVIHVQQDHLSDEVKWRCFYTLNHERRTVDYVHQPMLAEDPMAAVHGLVNALAKDIAQRLVGHFLKTHPRLLG